MTFPHLHIVTTQQLSRADAEYLLSEARAYRSYFLHSADYLTDLKNCIVVNAFFENSTRTRTSFEVAAKRLGAEVVNFSSTGSSVAKGESLFDTLQTLDAMRPDIIVMRHQASGAAEFATTCTSASILNAGDGKHEHPSQALLDALTLLDALGSLEGKKIGIVGDIQHSRVARSNIYLLRTLGADVAVCAPATLLPRDVEVFGVELFSTIDEVVDWSDAIMGLRLQRERMESGLLATAGEYHRYFGIKNTHLQRKPELIVLHPGPVNYGVEIEFEAANSTQSLIRTQVANGVYIRMAMMKLLMRSRRGG